MKESCLKMKKFGINFKLVLTSQTISLIGGNILNFALLLFILDFTQSAGTFGLIMAISQIPVVLFSMVGGIIADRMDKKKLIVAFDAIKTVICFALLAIFLTGAYSVINLTIIMVVFMAVVTLFGPILTSATPSIVDKELLVEANGAMGAIQSMSDLFGVLIGGALFATLGITNIIILASVAFFISTVIDLFIKIPHVKKKAEFGALKTASLDLKESFHYATKQNPFIIKISLLFALLALIFMPIIAIALPYIVRVEFGASDMMFTLSQAASGVGMLLGGSLSGKFKKWLNTTYFSKLILITAALTLVLAISVHTPLFDGATLIPFLLFNLAILLIMTMFTFLNITVMSRIQKEVPNKYLGKIVALFMTIISFATPMGQYALGQSMELFAGRTSVLFVVIAVLTVGIAGVAKKLLNSKVENYKNDLEVTLSRTEENIVTYTG